MQKKGVLSLASKAVRQNNTRSSAYIKEHNLDSNLRGEGFILGGLYVIRAGEGGIVMQKNEENLGISQPWMRCWRRPVPLRTQGRRRRARAEPAK